MAIRDAVRNILEITGDDLRLDSCRGLAVKCFIMTEAHCFGFYSLFYITRGL
jgi:hypothetical protein